MATYIPRTIEVPITLKLSVDHESVRQVIEAIEALENRIKHTNHNTKENSTDGTR